MDQHYKNQQLLKQKDCHTYSMHEKIPENAHMYEQMDIKPCKGSKKKCMQCSQNNKLLIAAVIFLLTFILYTSVMTAMLYLKLETMKSLGVTNANSNVTVQTCSCEEEGTLSHLTTTTTILLVVGTLLLCTTTLGLKVYCGLQVQYMSKTACGPNYYSCLFVMAHNITLKMYIIKAFFLLLQNS